MPDEPHQPETPPAPERPPRAFRVVGKSVPREDLPDKAAGAARFAADAPLVRPLVGLILRSPHPRARVLSIDASAARRTPGTRVVLLGGDCPAHRFGDEIRDLRWLARDGFVRCVGDPVAAVAAESMDAARDALEAVRVDYEPLEPVTDLAAASGGEGPLVHEDWEKAGLGPGGEGNVIGRYEASIGDARAAMRKADRVFEHVFRTPYAHSGYIEPHACAAEPGADGKVTIWTTTQAPFVIREQVAAALGVPLAKVRVVPMEVGGGFGGKLHSFIEHVVALLALRSGRAVRHEMTREDDHLFVGPRQALRIRLKTGVSADGLILAREADVVMDHGAYAPNAPTDASSRIPMFASCYAIPAASVKMTSVYTNGPVCGSVRGPSGPQCYFATEVHLDVIARELGIDPLEIRRKNAIREGGAGLFGVQKDDGMREVLESAAAEAGWGEAVRTDENLEGAGWRLGRGLAAAFWRGSGGASSCTARLNADGSVHLQSGSVNLTGSATSMRQIAAEEMGLDVGRVSFGSGDTDTAPESVRAAGSMATRSMGAAVLAAVEDLKEKIRAVAAEKLEADPRDLRIEEGRVFAESAPERSMPLSEAARAAPGVSGYVMGQGETPAPALCPIYTAQEAEVAVNPDSGEVRVLRLVCAQDVGFAMNPASIVGQMEGGMLQGLGLALMEEQPRGADGRVRGETLHDYLLPTSMDLPELKTVMIENGAADTPYGMRGVGEPPILAAPAAIMNAIADAVGARFFEIPVGPHHVLEALGKTAKSGG